MHDELEHETGPESMTKAELKAEARARGLSIAGTGQALLRRILDHDGRPTDAEGEGEPAERESAEGEGERAEGEREPAEGEGERAEGEREPAEGEEEQAEGEPVEGPGEREPERDGEAGAEDDGAGGGRDEELEERGDGRSDARSIKLDEVLTEAAESLMELTGRPLDAVSGVQATDQGYRVTVEVLELSRVPSTTDVLATYEVDVDRDGHVTGFSRSHRYYRNQTSRE